MAKINYPAHLEAMWQKAIAPREANAPTVISTFAGGGGSLTGYMMAGFHDLLAVEWDNNAVETLRLNWPELDIYHGDIAKLSVDEVLQRTGLKPGELDILDGSPPCQGFSTAGKRVMDDPRNQLFREYVRLLRGLRPKVLIMENVSGMVKGRMKLVFVEILKELKASGYKVSARLLNAMYFHVPQSRQRMIFIGVRDDLGIEPSHPGAESEPVTVGQAWESISISAGDMQYAKKIIEHRPGIAKWLKVTPQGQQLSKYESRGFFWNWARLDFSKPARAIPKEDTNICHPTEMRAIAYREAARLGSFPDSYDFGENPHQGRARIGNSVPPLMVEAIARHVRREILDKVKETAVTP